LSGSREEKRRGNDYRADQTLGPVKTAWGAFAGTAWHVDANGQLLMESGLHHADDVDSSALRMAAHVGVTLSGEVSSPVEAFVVTVDPPGGRREFVFFDKKTYLIDRVETVRDGRRYATVFDDYRSTKGLMEPWHVHVSDGFVTNDDDEVLESLSLGDALTAADVAIPANGPPLFSLSTSSAPIPITMDSDNIVVPVKMGGHIVDFLLDSGAEEIVIDKDIVKALNIPEYGRTTSQTAGTYVSSNVVLPSMTLGTLTLNNVHALSLPFEQWSSTGKPIAGLLGHDFIASAVLHIDYGHGTLEVLAPGTFVPPSGAHAFNVTFDDGVPTVAAALDGVSAPSFIVDTGADRSALFSTFVSGHQQQIADQGLGSAMQAASPFVDNIRGVGGTVEYRPLQTGPFALGPWSFPKWLFMVTQNAPAFEFEDYDGLIGQDVLRNFDVYLDYPHGKIYMVPNDRFRQRWPV
jgi:predicted aspartyl protease